MKAIKGDLTCFTNFCLLAYLSSLKGSSSPGPYIGQTGADHQRSANCRVDMSHLSCSDSAVKQILLTMNERWNFIIEDLDDFHVVIKADEEYRVRRELESEVGRTSPFFSAFGACCVISVGLLRALTPPSWRRIHTASRANGSDPTAPGSSEKTHT
jgi:TFIIH basal transcription factor complex TTD-A subunit